MKVPQIKDAEGEFVTIPFARPKKRGLNMPTPISQATDARINRITSCLLGATVNEIVINDIKSLIARIDADRESYKRMAVQLAYTVLELNKRAGGMSEEAVAAANEVLRKIPDAFPFSNSSIVAHLENAINAASALRAVQSEKGT